MNVPPGISHPAITKAAEHHSKMVESREKARAALKAAERSRPTAVEQDATAYAEALTKGAKDPGEKHTIKADEEIHQAKRRFAALDKAARTAAVAVLDAVQSHRGDIATALQDRLIAADRMWTEAVDSLEAAGQERGHVLSGLEWIDRGDYERPAPTVGGWVPGLTLRRAQSGEIPAHMPEVVRALREVADPPDRSPAPQAVGGSLGAFLGVDPDA